MELTGILLWSVELGQMDFMINVSLLSSYRIQLHVGHLDQGFHIFRYLKWNKCSTIVFHEQQVDWNAVSFEQHWTDFYLLEKPDKSSVAGKFYFSPFCIFSFQRVRYPSLMRTCSA
jgi:hypothetical protein